MWIWSTRYCWPFKTAPEKASILHYVGTLYVSHITFSVSKIQPPLSTVSCILVVFLQVLGWGGSDVQLKSTSDSSSNFDKVNQSCSCEPLRRSCLFPFHVLLWCCVGCSLPPVTPPTQPLSSSQIAQILWDEKPPLLALKRCLWHILKPGA